MLHKYYGMKSLCPSCNSTTELTAHMLLRKSSHRMALKETLLTRFLIQLQNIGTPSLVCSLIQHGMSSVLFISTGTRHPPTYGSVKPEDVLATQCYTDQSSLGWVQFFQGRLSLK
jgi:hypothetical protein